MLEVDYLRGRAFALFLRPHPVRIKTAYVSPEILGNLSIFLKKIANARGSVGGGRGWAPLELTDALVVVSPLSFLNSILIPLHAIIIIIIFVLL